MSSQQALSVHIPREPAERRAWVMWQLSRRRLTLTDLAVEIGVSQSAMSHALLAPSSHIEAVIAKAIGVSVTDLFPERFDEQGNRLFRTRQPKRSTGVPRRNVRSRRVA